MNATTDDYYNYYNSSVESQSSSSSSLEEEDDYEDQISSLSVTQDKVLALLPIIPSLLSAWGSAQIIWMVLTGPKKSAYRRILLGMSCSDFVSSLSLIWQPFLVPANTSQSVWAIGTDATCNALGWFVQFAFCSVWYNMMLSVYFLLLVRFGVKDQVFQRRYEPFLHLMCVGFPLVTASVGAAIGLYRENRVGDGCWITRYPEGCFDCDEEMPDDPDLVCCISSRFGWSFGGVPTMMSFVIIVTNYLVVYCHVQRTVSLHDTVMSSRSPTRDPHMRRIRAVLSQCCLYVAAFLFCYLPAFALRVMESLTFDPEDEDKLFPMLVIQAVTLPLQGMLNCFVYVRPTYLRVRKDFPNESKYWAFRRALHGDRIQPTDEHRASSLFEAPAFSHVVLSPSQAHNKPSKLATGISASHTSRDGTTTHDTSWSHTSRRHTPNENECTEEMPPIMPRRMFTQSADDFDFDDNDDNENQTTDVSGAPWTKGGFLLSLRLKRNNNSSKNQRHSNPPPKRLGGDSSHFGVSSLVGSEFNCVDAAPVKPNRVESQIDGLPPIPSKMNEFTSSELKHRDCHDDRLPVAPIPLRERSYIAEDEEHQLQQPQNQQQPADRCGDVPLPIETRADEDFINIDQKDTSPKDKPSSSAEGSGPKKGGFLLTLRQKTDPQPNGSQFVSSLVGSEFDCVDEAPAPPDRVESQAEEGLPPIPYKANRFIDDKMPMAPQREGSTHEQQPTSMTTKELNPEAAEPPVHLHPPSGRRNPVKGFLLSLKQKKNPQPGDSQFVSSLVGSEFDFIDKAPEPPDRVGSQAEGVPQPIPQEGNQNPCSEFKNDDKSPVLPARERSSAEKQSRDSTIQIDVPAEPSNSPPPDRNSFKGFVLHLLGKKSPRQDESQFVSSLATGSGFEGVDEAPAQPARAESQGESVPQPPTPSQID